MNKLDRSLGLLLIMVILFSLIIFVMGYRVISSQKQFIERYQNISTRAISGWNETLMELVDCRVQLINIKYNKNYTKEDLLDYISK